MIFNPQLNKYSMLIFGITKSIANNYISRRSIIFIKQPFTSPTSRINL